MVSGVARGPSRIVAGSPGMRRVSDSNKATAPTTATAAAISLKTRWRRMGLDSQGVAKRGRRDDPATCPRRQPSLKAV